MSELFLQISVSLDGYIEDRQKDIEWMTSDVSMDDLATRTLQSIDGMIFGRTAHTLLASFWPTAASSTGASPDLIEQARLMNSLPKYVLTHGTETADWANSHAIRPEAVAGLKRAAARPLAVFAGAAAAMALLDDDLVDEIHVIQYPVVLGGGTRLFADERPRRTLTLVGGEDYPSGATVRRYRFVTP